jgi:DNA-binding GntR family transcriptional regulator
MQEAPLALVRENTVSDAVAVELRNMIVDGRLGAGRVNEVQLSQQLGVSRTPIREALNRLAHEGALTSVPRLGYFISPFTFEEFHQVHAIRPLLDPEALRLAGLPTADRLKRLEAINDRMTVARDAAAVIDLDDQFHFLLIESCPNKVLIDLINQFVLRTRRYEIALMREQENVVVAQNNHKAILSALRRRDLNRACAALQVNLQSGYEPIATWLKERERNTTEADTHRSRR